MKISSSLFTCLSTLTLFLNSLWAAQNPIIGVYYENWSQYRPASGGRAAFTPDQIDPTIITDLYYAFAVFGFVTQSINPTNPHLTGDFTVQPVEWNDQSILYPQIQALKQKNPQLRTLLSIGGWGFNDPNDPNRIGTSTYRLFSQMVSRPENRTQFIQSAIAYAHRYGFDGIDIDWEYPGDITRGGTDEDFSNFVQFLQEMQKACHSTVPSLLVTYAAPAIVPSGVPQKYRDNPHMYFEWLRDCSHYLDRLNVMAYDYHGPFDFPRITGVNAPLNQDGPSSGASLCIEQTVKNYLESGISADKIVLGIATYGHSYGGVEELTTSSNGPGKNFSVSGNPGPSTRSSGLLSYYEIADMLALKQLAFGTDSQTKTAYAYDIASQQWVSFDTPDTVALKASFAKERGLSGIMFWAVDNDEYQWGEKYPNIRKGYSLFYQSKKAQRKR